jgi:MinD-like ATPase involved in chromosome partitioning or flagellar assembly
MTVSIAITSGKGGVGKTNCAVNVALSLSKTGKKGSAV